MGADGIASRVFERVQISSLEAALQELNGEALAQRSQREWVDRELEEERARRSKAEDQLAAALAAHTADGQQWQEDREELTASAFPGKGSNHRRTAAEYTMLNDETNGHGDGMRVAFISAGQEKV